MHKHRTRKMFQKRMNEGLNVYELLDAFKANIQDLEIWLDDDRSFYLDYLKAIGMTEKQDSFLKVYKSAMCNVSKACRIVKIHRSTYYDWLQKSDSFRKMVQYAKEEMYDDVESILLQKIFIERNTRVLIFYASTKMKERGYGSQVIVKGDSRMINSLNQNPYLGLPIEEIDKKLKPHENKLEKI